MGDESLVRVDAVRRAGSYLSFHAAELDRERPDIHALVVLQRIIAQALEASSRYSVKRRQMRSGVVVVHDPSPATRTRTAGMCR